MIEKQSSQNRGAVRVTFGLPGSIRAESVHLVGQFYDWDRPCLPLRGNGRGDADWELTLELETGSEYVLA